MQSRRTIYARALEDLASLARRPQPIAFYLDHRPSVSPKLLEGSSCQGKVWTLQALILLDSRTFLLRHDLQFIDSRGSLLIRRAGSLSMPTCGRDMGSGCIPGGGGTMPVASKGTVMPKVMNGICRD